MTYEVVRRCNYYISGTFEEAGMLAKGEEIDIVAKSRGYNKAIWGTFEREGQKYDVPIRTHGAEVLKVKEVKDGESTKRPRKSAAGRGSR